MKVTDEMVDAALKGYSSKVRPQYSDHVECMAAAIQEVFSLIEKESAKREIISGDIFDSFPPELAIMDKPDNEECACDEPLPSFTRAHCERCWDKWIAGVSKPYKKSVPEKEKIPTLNEYIIPRLKAIEAELDPFYLLSFISSYLDKYMMEKTEKS